MDIPQHLANQMRDLIEVQMVTQWRAAEILGLTRKQMTRRIRQLGLKTQRTGPRSGVGHPEWKGGRHQDADGYWLVYAPEHPHARRGGRGRQGRYILEHRLVMERKLGRLLERHEVVHHVNGQNDDNRPENLELFQSNAEHLCQELKGRVPRWTEDGKARIRAGVLKAAAKHRQRKEQRAQERQPAMTHQKTDTAESRPLA